MITPQTEHPELAKALGVEKIYLKREDLHPYGSHKGRSIPTMIDIKCGEGATSFAISSSGNAALAAVRYIQEKNSKGSALSLSIILGNNINLEKALRISSEITDKKITVTQTPRPLQTLFNILKIGDMVSLRQSNDDNALLGYKILAKEIGGTPNLSAVFLGTSSGTTAQALAENFKDMQKPISVKIVQTTTCHPMAEMFDLENGNKLFKTPISIADAIIDKIALRKFSVINILKETKGDGFIATDQDIQKAITLIKETAGIETTPNGALGVAGLIRALSQGKKFPGAVVCVITGK